MQTLEAPKIVSKRDNIRQANLPLTFLFEVNDMFNNIGYKFTKENDLASQLIKFACETCTNKN